MIRVCAENSFGQKFEVFFDRLSSALKSVQDLAIYHDCDSFDIDYVNGKEDDE